MTRIKTCKDAHDLCLIVTFIKGAPLTKLLAMKPKLPLDLIRFILLQTANLLTDLKKVGILYRDLKLSNIMIDSSFKCKLVDFGLSKRIGHGRTNSICGTPHSSPPELYSPEGYSYPLDAFTLGVVAYELLVGKPPFAYDSTFEDSKKRDFKALESSFSLIEDIFVRDLVSGLLFDEEEKRLKIETALKHPFLSFEEPDYQKHVEFESKRLQELYHSIKEDIELVEETDEEVDNDANMIQF